jgi:hypothetical protein
MKLIRKGGTLDKHDSGYSVRVDYYYEGDFFETDPGFAGARFDVIIPLEVGNRMTVDELHKEAFRRIDLIRDLL